MHVFLVLVCGVEVREMLVAVACAGMAAADSRAENGSNRARGWWAASGKACGKQWAASLFVHKQCTC